jgi:hypothetical protein
MQPSDPWARWSYEQLRIGQPHVETAGLWRLGNSYYILCPALNDNSRASDGRSVVEWFNDHRALTAPVSLVRALPNGAEQVPERTLDDAIRLSGEPLTLWHLVAELSLRLPRTFPLLRVIDGSSPMSVRIVVSRSLSDPEEVILDSVMVSLQQPFVAYEIELRSPTNGEESQAAASPASFGGLPEIIPSRLLFGTASNRLRAKYEEDEDFWLANQIELLKSWSVEPESLIPGAEWNRATSRCVLFAHSSTLVLPIINPLCIFRKVALVLSPQVTIEQLCSSLKCTAAELLELIELDRVQLVLSHSPDNYPIRFLEQATELSAGNVLFPRRLTALVIADARKRVPFLFAPFDAHERAAIVRALREVANSAKDLSARRVLERASTALPELWSSTYSLVHRSGSIGASLVGLGGLVGRLFGDAGPNDHQIEFLHAGLIVQYAGALNALAFPTTNVDNPFVEILATFYSKGPITSVPDFASKLETLVSGLLAVDSGVSPVELAKSLGHGDIDRFRSLIEDVSRANHDQDAILATVARFNAAIEVYGGKNTSFKKLDIRTLLDSLLDLAGIPGVNLAGWLVMQVVRRLSEHGPDNAILGSIIDSVEGIVKRSQPQAILVGRMRSAIARAGSARE